MTEESNIHFLTYTLISQLPKTVFTDFKKWVIEEGMSPSQALRKLMEEYRCPNPDSSVAIRLVEYVYPEFDITRNAFTFKVHDSGYPVVQVDLDDDGFDKLVEETRKLSLLDSW